MRDRRADASMRLDGLEAAARFFSKRVAASNPSVENLWVAHLDASAACLHLMHRSGDLDGADVPIRSIVIDAAKLGTAGLLVAHTHPSGDSTPSVADCHATRRLAAIAEALGCRLIDHLVFAGEDFTSFRKSGLL